MRATELEFKARFWIIGIIIWVGFSLYYLDQANFGAWILHLVAPTLDLDGKRGNFWLRVVFGSGALLVFLSAILRTWATAYLRVEVVHDAGIHSEALVADGPFRYVRNPLYLANLPLAAGIGVMASRTGWIVMVVGMLIFMYRLILREEAGLLESQGESYRAYCKAVPRLWPALSPRVAAGNGQAHWGQAFAAEMFVWLFGVAELCFAITLQFKLAAIIFAASMVLYFAIVPRIMKRSGQPPPSA